MSFKVINNSVLKRQTKIWKKIISFVSKKFYSKPVYGDNDKYIKAKIRIHGDKVNTNFKGKKVPNENEPYKCTSITMLDHQALLEECKYEEKKTRMKNIINDDLESISSDNKSDTEFNKSGRDGSDE